MRWTERQLAMLREMGVELWSRRAPADVELGAAVLDEAAAPSPGTPALQAAPVPVREGQASNALSAATSSASAASNSRGLARADWLVVSESFDPAEAADGAPWQLLDNMLHAIGVARTAPESSARAAFLSLADRAAGPARAGRGDGELRAAIAAVKPRCIVALGRARPHNRGPIDNDRIKNL